MNKNGMSTVTVNRVARRIKPSRGFLFGVLILGALIAFEIFNYSTTDFALSDLLGNLRFADVRWSTILAIAFCGIDFAGIARLFTPEQGSGEPKEVWYLFGAWLLAATMNAVLTWWGVAIAILSHTSLGDAVISPDTLVKVVPIFVAIMVWVIRVLIIGTFSVAGDRLFSQSDSVSQTRTAPALHPAQPLAPSAVMAAQAAQRTSPTRPDPKPNQPGFGRSEPTYHPASMSGEVGSKPCRSVSQGVA